MFQAWLHHHPAMAAQALLAEEQRKERTLNFDDASTDAGSELSELPGGKNDAEKASPTEGKTLNTLKYSEKKLVFHQPSLRIFQSFFAKQLQCIIMYNLNTGQDMSLE